MYEVFVENIGCVHAQRDSRADALALALYYRNERRQSAWVYLDGELIREFYPVSASDDSAQTQE